MKQKPPFEPGTQIVAYLRDSGGTEQELSVERQTREITAWAREYGIEVTRLFVDEARSGRSLHGRKDLQAMMDYFRGGAEEAGVIVWAYDRFARNSIHAQLYRAELRSLGKVFYSLTDYIPDGPEGVFFEAAKDYVAEQFSHRLSINVKSGLRMLLETYGAMPGTPPVGFKREPIHIGRHRNGRERIVHKWVPDPEVVPLVRMAFEMRARGETLKRIIDATHLYPSMNSWITFFGNAIYKGVLEYGDLVIENYCEPIIPSEIWQAANDVGKARSHISSDHSPRRIGSDFLLSGVVYCQHCGSPMNGHVIAKAGKPRRDYYTCSRKYRRRDCPAREVPRQALEDEVTRVLTDIILDLGMMLTIQGKVVERYKRIAFENSGELRRLRASLGQIQKKINNLVEAISEDPKSPSLLKGLHAAEAKEAKTREDIRRLEANRPPTEYTTPQLSAMAEEIKRIMAGDDQNLKRATIHALISRLIVARSDASIDGVLYYVPLQLGNVCVGEGAPAEDHTERIQIFIAIPRYTKAPR